MSTSYIFLTIHNIKDTPIRFFNGIKLSDVIKWHIFKNLTENCHLNRSRHFGFSATASPEDLACLAANAMRSDNIDRIAPSLHMRSDTPPSRPNAAVFSFRNNENVSHSEVKFATNVLYLVLGYKWQQTTLYLPVTDLT